MKCARKWCFLFSLLYLVLLLCLLSYRASAQTPELDSLFSTALNSLENSANKIDSLRNELSESRSYVNSLETLSKEQRETLNRQAETLETQSVSLRNINGELTGISNQLLISKEKLKVAIKWVIGLAVMLVIQICMKIAGYILYAKGVKLPRWLDILL
jgi:septal ring factor EnvC (AmiA/AmiB activator)